MLEGEVVQLDRLREQQSMTIMVPDFEAGYRLARMIGMTRQGFQKIKESEVGLKVVNHFSHRSLWSKRPELLQSVVKKAIEFNEPAWSELALRIFGDYGARVTAEVKDKPRVKPQDLDQELIQQAKLLNMTPNRFQLLWASNDS